MRSLDITAFVVDKTEPSLKGNKLHSYATIEDETGKILLNLWREQVNQVQVGDKINVPNAFVQRRYGTLQVSTWSNLVVLDRKQEKIRFFEERV